MARKGWNALSANYRARLEKAGISKTDYESGQSIRSARGHLNTPERPSQASAFPTYQAERNRLTNRIVRMKQAFFGTSPKWNPAKAKATFAQKPPPMAQLKFWSQMDEQDWLHAIREDPTAAAYLGYH